MVSTVSTRAPVDSGADPVRGLSRLVRVVHEGEACYTGRIPWQVIPSCGTRYVYRVSSGAPTVIEGGNIGILGSAPGDRSTTQDNLPPLTQCCAFFTFFLFRPPFPALCRFSRFGKFPGFPPFAVSEDLKRPGHEARQDVPSAKPCFAFGHLCMKTIGSNTPWTRGPA